MRFTIIDKYVVMNGERLRELLTQFGAERDIIFTTREELGKLPGGVQSGMNFLVSLPGDKIQAVFYESLGYKQGGQPCYRVLHQGELIEFTLGCAVKYRWSGDEEKLHRIVGIEFARWILNQNETTPRE